MLRHAHTLPIVRCGHSQSRCAATAAKTQPRPTASALGKWALPPTNASPGGSGSQAWPADVNSPHTGAERAKENASTSAACKSSSEPSTSTGHRWTPRSTTSATSSAAGSSYISKPPPSSGVNRWAPSQPSRSPANQLSKAPQRLSQSPSSNALNRWAPQVPPPSSVPKQRDHENFSPQSRTPPTYQASSRDPRLQRDIAPHQGLSNFGKRPASYTDRDHARPSVVQNRRNLEDRPVASSSRSPSHIDNGHTPRLNASDFNNHSQPLPPGSGEYFEKGRSARGGRHLKDNFKERGSLLSKIHDGVAISNSKGSISSQRQDAGKVKKPRTIIEKRVSADVFIPSTVSVGTLARLLDVRLELLQRKMRQSGMENEANYDHVLTSDYAVLLAEEFGRHPIVNDEAAFDIYPPPPSLNQSALPSRPPVVTIMGHVDHGKTTLLDTLRSASVAKGEAGGITQHIGAFSVPVDSNSSDGPKSITFLDTPGHAAFSAMRARGAGVTDIVVLVVAADDGIMPQTKEVIELVKKDDGKVGVVVAVNKVDKPGVNVDAVQKALMAEGIQLEVFGGDVPSVEVSGLTGHGLPELVETLSAMAEMQDLRAEREGLIHGYVLESKVLKGLGPVATVLILRGRLEVGAHILSGVNQAKVRLMTDSTGAIVKAAYPGMAITISGWKSLPKAGDEVLQGTETEIKKAITNRTHKAFLEHSLVDMVAINSSRRQERQQRELELELGENVKETAPAPVGPKELRLVIKADVSGSVEAVAGALQGIGNKEAVTKIVSSGVGDISESDVMMAKAIGGTIVGFSVSASRTIETLAARNNVPLCMSTIIYRLMDDVRNRVIALLPVIIETKVTGEATVLQLFDIQLKAKQVRKVAGCRVINGIVEKAKFARIVRDGETIYEGTLDTMRHLKKDVIEVRKGSECGLSFYGFSEIQEGDLIQVYQKIEKPGVL